MSISVSKIRKGLIVFFVHACTDLFSGSEVLVGDRNDGPAPQLEVLHQQEVQFVLLPGSDAEAVRLRRRRGPRV